MLKIAPFSTVSKTLRQLGYTVQKVGDSGKINVYSIEKKQRFFGTRREAWEWLLKTKQVRC